MDLQSRLTKYLKHKNLTYKDFEIVCNLSNGTAARLRDTTRESTFNRIANSCDLNVEWLKTGKGEMLKAQETISVKNFTDGVPYYDEDFLLGFDEIAGPTNEHPEYLINMPGYEKATLWCNASGHSMEPEINNGDIIALQRIEDFSFLPFGDIYGFITTNGLRTIKRLGRSDRDGFYKLIPTNKEYDTQEIPINKIALVYRVMGAMKAF